MRKESERVVIKLNTLIIGSPNVVIGQGDEPGSMVLAWNLTEAIKRSENRDTISRQRGLSMKKLLARSSPTLGEGRPQLPNASKEPTDQENIE
ncbi:MAG: hypothetical protein HY424_02295 [Candidatus Levybacteria bacterium]|nr:hypothetical protein [Candidatus Levybacteria bacterium]